MRYLERVEAYTSEHTGADDSACETLLWGYSLLWGVIDICQ